MFFTFMSNGEGMRLTFYHHHGYVEGEVAPHESRVSAAGTREDITEKQLYWVPRRKGGLLFLHEADW